MASKIHEVLSKLREYPLLQTTQADVADVGDTVDSLNF